MPAPAPAVPLVGGLVRLQPCPCKPQASHAPGQQCQLPVQDVPDMPFPRLCHLELPINSEQSTAWPGSRSTAVPDGAPGCAASREDFLSTPQWMLSPLLQEGCTATLLMGIPPWQLQEGLRCRKTSVTLPACQDFTLCLVGDTKAGLRHCLLTAGTPCKLCSHPIS